MAATMVFKRYELKYLLTASQKKKLLDLMKTKMALDEYGRSSIRNIYYDTIDYRLIRSSIEKPAYKEKLRVRSYGSAKGSSTVFAELKKKCDSVVYKRRIDLTLDESEDWLNFGGDMPKETQIAKEIAYFKSFYKTLGPAVYLSYEREAYFSTIDEDLRLTLDENILWRDVDLTLSSEPYGFDVIPKGSTLMELKTGTAIPLWLTKFLCEENVQKVSFSKYGEAYRQMFYGKSMKKRAKTA